MNARSGVRRRSVWLRIAASLALLLAAALACVPPQGGWDPEALERRHPELASFAEQRLADSLPFLTIDRTGVELFLCRWPTERAIPVSLPVDLSEEEYAGLRAALAAWQGAGLGVRFREGPRSEAAIVFEVLEADDRAFDLGRTGDTITDCGVVSRFDAAPSSDPVDAELRFASIYLRRANLDVLGQTQPLSASRFAGEALHELGHALGFPGHVAWGKSVMVREHEIANHWGERILAGQAFHDASLAALYALPVGIHVGRLEVPEASLAALREFAAATGTGWRGPFVRVGERAALIHWRSPSGGIARFRARDWRGVLRGDAALVLEPNDLASRALESGRARP